MRLWQVGILGVGLTAGAAFTYPAPAEAGRDSWGSLLSGPRPDSLDVERVPIRVLSAATMRRGDGTDARFVVLCLPPMPVWAFRALRGSLVPTDLILLNFPPPNEREVQIPLFPRTFEPENGDRLLLFWSETLGTATPWAEIVSEGDRHYVLRPVPDDIPTDLVVTVPSRPDGLSGNPAKAGGGESGDTPR